MERSPAAITRFLILIWVIMLLAGRAGLAHDLGPGDILISPIGRLIETGAYMISPNVITAARIGADRQHFGPELWPGWDDAAVTLLKKATKHQKTFLSPLDGGFEPHFQAFEEPTYCGEHVIFVRMWRDTPHFGSMLDRWLTTWMFHGESLAMLAEVDAAGTEITQHKAGYLAKMPSTMTNRFPVSCVPQRLDRRFSLGVIDHGALYRPDWCGAQAVRCEVPP